MPVFEIKKQDEWPEQEEFLQSYTYGEFLISLSKKVLRLCIQVGEEKIYVQAVEHIMFRFITFLYIPRMYIAPIFFEKLVQYAKKKNYTFIRLEPSQQMNLSSVKLQEVKNRQPQYTWILDINKTTEQLLQEMHSKTRYNIRVAEKKEVYIDHVKNLDVFLKLNETTTERNKFISHPRQYIEKLLSLSDVFQFNAYIDKTPVASAIILRHQKSFIYLLGASSNEYRNAMSPYLLHWDIINTGKKEGIDTYDFWGIAPPAKKENVGTVCFHTYCFEDIHPLSGVSRFKAGWGGAVKSYPQAYEIIINPLTYIIVKFIYALRGRNRIVGHPDN